LKKTPKLRLDADGGTVCVECGEPFEIAPRPGLSPMSYIDPFCSATCARRYYGTQSEIEKKKEAAR
jgi:hypothetical protein